MDLWSKGLGRLVLGIRLNERSDMGVEGDDLVMKGTMGKPTFWDWSVNLDDADVVDFLVFLQRPAPIRFMVRSDQRWQMLRSALSGAILFAAHTLRLMIFGAPRHQLPSASAADTVPETVTAQPIEEKS
jgi:hypothetical protein